MPNLRHLLVDLAAIAALAVLLGLAFLPSYGNGWLWVAVLGGTAVGVGVGLISERRRWGPGRSALAVVAAWFLLGTVLAMPTQGIGYLIPTPRTLRGLVLGPLNGWREMLTTDPPLGTTGNLMTVALLLAMWSGLGALAISRRSRRPGLAWLPQALAIVVAFALGTTASVAPGWVGLALVVVVLCWTSYQRSVRRTHLVIGSRGVRLAGLGMAAGTLVGVGLLSLLAYPAIAPAEDRAVVRQIVDQPLDVQRYASPMQGFRFNITDRRETALLEVSGAPPGAVLRVATLDAYDGMVFGASNTPTNPMTGQYRRIGERIDDPTQGVLADVEVRLLDYSSVWLPTVGHTLDVNFDSDDALELGDALYFNKASQTALVSVGLHAGDSYRLQAVVPKRPTTNQLAAAGAPTQSLPHTDVIPEAVRSLAGAWTEDANGKGEMALRLEAQLRQGYFSHGTDDEVTSLPGHSYARVADLLARPDAMVGDHEQYAVAMALMARELGISARVVYGYQLPESGSGTITGDDVAAWPELYFDSLGWVLFDPTPPKTRVLEEQQNPDSPMLRPHVDNPPPPVQRPKNRPPDTDVPIDTGQAPPQPDEIDWRQVSFWAALIGVPTATIIVPIAAILLAKQRRRSRRQHAPEVVRRISGGWAELVDLARDLGRSPSVAATRTEQAERMGNDFVRLNDAVNPVELARQADALVFAPEPVGEAEAVGFWSSIDRARQGMQRSVGRWAWLRGWLSTRSFRNIVAPKVGTKR